MRKIIATLAIILMVGAANAAPPSDSAIIQRGQQQLLDDQLRQQELDSVAAGSPYAEGKAKPVAEQKPAKPAGRCVEIKQISFAGNTILSDRAVRRITRIYEGRCLYVEEINAMLNDITNACLGKGYATSRAFMEMPQTRLQDGILDIRIIEGRINRIEGLDLTEQITAFPFLTDRILNIRDIEQGLDQMNRLGSNKASMDVKAAPGQDSQAISNIEIKNEPLGRTQIGGTLDNYGTDSTGQWRAGLRLVEDNLLGLNDQISLSLTHSIVPNIDHKNSRSAMAGFSVPFGYWTISNNFSYSEYRTSFPMPISGDRFYSLGDSMNNTFSIDRMLWRGQTYKLAATVGLTYKNNENFMKVYDLQMRNDSSSRSLATASFDLPLTLYFPIGMVYVKPGIVRGLHAFGSADDHNSPYTQKAQYTAAKFYAFTNLNLKYVVAAVAFDSQWTKDELFSTESFYLGGESSIRGFRNDSTMGDSGFSLRNDIGFVLPKIFDSENKWLARFTPGIFYDFGRIFPNATGREPHNLSGAGAKVGFKYWLIDASAAYARVLLKEDWMTEEYSVYLYAGISGRF